MDVYQWIELYGVKQAIIPTVVLPFTILGVLLTMLATFIAGLFGIQLKAEGPRKLLEVLLKPRILLTALIVNLLSVGGYYGYQWVKTYPSFLWTINNNNPVNTLATDQHYKDVFFEKNNFTQPLIKKAIKNVKLSWETKIPKGSFGGLIISGNSLFFGSGDGNGYEVDKNSGKILRKFYVGQPVTPRPVVWKNYLYLAEGVHLTHHARIYQFDLMTGQLINSFQSTGHIEGALSLYSFKDDEKQKNIIFVSSGRDGLHALNAEDLSPFWHSSVGHIDASVKVVNDLVYVTTGMEKGEKRENQQAYAIDIKTGKTKWVAELPASGWVSSVVYGTEICFGLGEVYFRRNYGQIACFDQMTGESTWAVNQGASLIGRPMIVKDTLYISDFFGGIYAYHMKTRKKLWYIKTKVKKYAYAPVAYNGNGHIIYPTVLDGLIFINGETGSIDFSWQPKNLKKDWYISLAGVAVDNENSAYLIDWKGRLRKFDTSY
ncbi:MAG: PQQ-binding-like beta-propeller repeat protein [Bdellovibrionaceae bacterium]|nr:PQQ-binding-like beta-propeller repeat protein [Pseudobdellovibrionaceae bacterium]